MERKSKINNVLVTGGAGYIGSVVAQLLQEQNIQVHICDNLSTGNEWAVEGDFYREDIKNTSRIEEILRHHNIEAVLHFAAFSQVGESVQNPEKYYSNNVGGTLSLLKAMTRTGCNKLVFSSTAAVYGNPAQIPIGEQHPLNPVNPYGKSKFFVEEIIRDFTRISDLSSVIFRYFNASGSYKDRGELHQPETHLIPNLYLAWKKGEPFYLFGDDYDTPDGTCIRDFINVYDLAQAHYMGLEFLSGKPGVQIFNLGTGEGYSVRQVAEVAQKLLPTPLEIEINPRRKGDPPVLVADYQRAKNILGWQPETSLKDSIHQCFKYLSHHLNQLP